MGTAKCKEFGNLHCCTSDCPNIRCDEFEERYDLPSSDIGLERVACRHCEYNDKNCTCDDCLFQNSEYCQETRTQNQVRKETVE